MKIEKGMKAKGFKFEYINDGLYYNREMDEYIGKEGVVHRLNASLTIMFEDGKFWDYPLGLAHKALLSVGDKVKIPKTKSAGWASIKDSIVIERAISKGQDFLYYAGECDGRLMLNDKDGMPSGDYFRLEDVELYEKENKMEIKKSELEKIYNVACSTWQVKIKDMANRNPFGDSIELTQEEIGIMFRASTPSQTEVLEEVFGKQNKEINLCSEDINHIVDGLPVFGGSKLDAHSALIGLPLCKDDENVFFLNSNYNWKLEENTLTITRR